MKARIAWPWRRSPTMIPYARGSANGMTSSRKISKRLVMAFGFSNGCAEFALKKPPPLVPSSLIASCDATRPPGIDCAAPVTPVTSVGAARFWMTPPRTRTTAATAAIGRRTRTTTRVRSTQKLPMYRLSCRAMARMRAATTAIPTAAEAKFWTVRPTAWTNTDVPASPAYDCQFVLVTNETAVLRAVSTCIDSPWFSGSQPWARITRNSSRKLTTEKAPTEAA